MAGLVLLLAAAGCVSVGPAQKAPVDLYELTALAAGEAVAGGPAAEWVLVVEEPLAAGALAGDRIAARPAPNQVQYLAGARWSEPLPAMVGRLLVESLGRGGGFAAVAGGETGLAGGCRLVTELRAFEVELDPGGGPAAARVRLAAWLLTPRRQAAAAHTFEAVEEAGSSRGEMVAALDRAFHRVTRELEAWARSAPCAG